ncbi:MAG: ZIP family metal transporter [Clostridium fessum]
MCGLKKTTMLVLAVTLHNIPEGMAVGVVFAGFLAEKSGITLAAALALSLGIAIQNFPEGAIISLPLRSESGMSRKKAFAMGTLSGIVEPIGALATIAAYRLSGTGSAGSPGACSRAMIYVVVEELIPESAQGSHSDMGTIGFAVGFVLMMILDVALG